MAKISLARKRELSEPDEFIVYSQKMLQKGIEYTKKNQLQVFGGIGLIVALILSVTLVQYFSNQSENKASLKFSQLMASYGKMVKEKSAQTAYQETKTDFHRFFEENSGTVSGKLGRLIYANLCFDQKDYDNAIPLYSKALQQIGKKPYFKNLILNGLAYCYEAKSDNAKSIEYFEKVVKRPDNYMKDEALFHLGVLYGRMNQAQKSRQAFEKLQSDYGESLYTDIVKEKLAAMDKG